MESRPVIVHEGEPEYVSELGRTYSETLSFRKTGLVAVVEGLQEAKLEVRKSVKRKCLLCSRLKKKKKKKKMRPVLNEVKRGHCEEGKWM